jgi:hypothetical protein
MIIMATKTKTTKTTKANPQTDKREFELQPIFSLWKRKSKDGKKTYFSGKTTDGDYVVGFYNTKKKNPKEPDLRVYYQPDEDMKYTRSFSIWHNVNDKTGKEYFSGVYQDESSTETYKIVGFKSKSKNEKAPELNFYIREEKTEAKQEPEYEQPPIPETPEFVSEEDDELELPF